MFDNNVYTIKRQTKFRGYTLQSICMFIKIELGSIRVKENTKASKVKGYGSN